MTMPLTNYEIDANIERKTVPVTECGCLIWLGTISVQGYPIIQRNTKKVRLNRYVLERKIGRPLREGEMSLHSCDVRSCVNPDHLRVGNAADNLADIRMRNPQDKRGERAGNVKLTREDVQAIRASFEPPRVLAKRFGVGPAYIWHIKARLTWKHIP